MSEEVLVSWVPVAAVTLPLVCSLIAYVMTKYSEKARNLFVVLVSVITFGLTMSMIPHIMGGKAVEFVLVSAEIAPLAIEFRVDYLGLIVGIASSFLWMLATIYSVGYMGPEHAKNRYYVFLLLTLGSMMGIVFTKNLFALYIFFEMMALTSYVLVIHEETPKALAAGRKYLFISIGFGLCLFFAIVTTYMLAGNVDLNHSGILPLDGPKTFYRIIFYSFIFGFGAKAGIFPVHVWLPDAHPIAPSPASALLSGVMIKAGAYGIIRVIYNIFGPQLTAELGVQVPLAVIAGITIFLGSAVAISQAEIKRMLAYSSISQIGYVVLGAILLTPRGLEGAIFHIFNHAFMKGCLFLCAGAIIYQTGLRKLEDFKGLGKRMPLTMRAFTVAALAMIGIPPLNGFVSKWILCLGALQAGRLTLILFVALLLLSSLMNAIYYMPIIIRAFFGENLHNKKASTNANDDPPLTMLIPILTLALGCIIFGIFSNLPLSIIKAAVNLLFGGV